MSHKRKRLTCALWATLWDSLVPVHRFYTWFTIEAIFDYYNSYPFHSFWHFAVLYSGRGIPDPENKFISLFEIIGFGFKSQNQKLVGLICCGLKRFLEQIFVQVYYCEISLPKNWPIFCERKRSQFPYPLQIAFDEIHMNVPLTNGPKFFVHLSKQTVLPISSKNRTGLLASVWWWRWYFSL